MKTSLFLKIFFGFIFLFSPAFVSADTGNLSGWAWSSTIGWISVTSLNDHNPSVAGIQPSPTQYGVTQNADGTLTGWAWSDNIGWIKFGGLSVFPTGGGTVAQNAKLNVSGALEGWIRACAGTSAGDCSVMTDRTDGWDGWISLKGSTYGVTKSGSLFTGFGWGDVNVGWVSFDISSTLVPTLGFEIRANNVGGAVIPDGSTVTTGTQPTFIWTIENAPGVSCTLTNTVKPPAAALFGPLGPLTTSGNQTGPGLVILGVYTYEFLCNNGFTETISFTVGGGVATIDFDVKSGGPSGTSIAGNNTVPEGTQPTFVWTIENAPTVSCDITKIAGATAFNPIVGKISSGFETGNSLLSGLHTYRLLCTNGSTEDVTFTVNSPVTGITLGQDKVVRIQFSGSGPAYSTTATVPINRVGPVGSVNITLSAPPPPAGTTFTYSLDGGAFVASPTGSFGGVSFTFKAYASQRFTVPYTITLNGTSGSASDSVNITIDPRSGSAYEEI